jgi:hypothetical protein
MMLAALSDHYNVYAGGKCSPDIFSTVKFSTNQFHIPRRPNF